MATFKDLPPADIGARSRKLRSKVCDSETNLYRITIRRVVRRTRLRTGLVGERRSLLYPVSTAAISALARAGRH